MADRNRCSFCSRAFGAAAEIYYCSACGGVVHRECWTEAEERCPRCGGPVSSDPHFLPSTAGFDLAAALTGGTAAILAAISVMVLSQIPFRSDASGGAGVAFYFVFVPLAGAALVLSAIFALVCFARHDARRPRRLEVDR